MHNSGDIVETVAFVVETALAHLANMAKGYWLGMRQSKMLVVMAWLLVDQKQVSSVG
jgi:hypothetical protein